MIKTHKRILTAALFMMPLTSFAELDAKFAGALICSDTRPVDYSIMACNMGGKSTLNLYAEGKNLVSIDEGSLVLTKLNVGNENLLKLENGNPNYEIGSFADIEANGTLAEWDIELKSGLTTLAGKVSIKGSLTAYTGSGSVTEESPLFDFNNHKEMQIGPVRLIQTAQSKKTDNNIIEQLKSEGVHSDENIALFEEMLNTGLISQDKSLPQMDKDLRKAYPNLDDSTKQAIGPMIMAYKGDDFLNFSGNDDDQINLKLDVDEQAIENIELKSASGEILSSQGTMTSNGVVSYFFAKPESGKVQLFVQYQKDLKPITINIDI